MQTLEKNLGMNSKFLDEIPEASGREWISWYVHGYSSYWQLMATWRCSCFFLGVGLLYGANFQAWRTWFFIHTIGTLRKSNFQQR